MVSGPGYMIRPALFLKGNLLQKGFPLYVRTPPAPVRTPSHGRTPHWALGRCVRSWPWVSLSRHIQSSSIPLTHALTHSQPLPPQRASLRHPNPTDRLNPPPTDRTILHLPRTPLTSSHMPTIEKQRVHLLLIADLTQPHLLIRDFKPHHPLPVSLPFLEPARIHVPRLGIHHLALAFGFIVRPGADVGVSVGVAHRAVAMFEA